jgi:hypothetical protein
LNNSWRHLFGIQKVEAMHPETQSSLSLDMFLKTPPNFAIKKKHFITHIEDHTSEHFQELKKKNVLMEPYDRNKHKDLIDVEYPQMEPDMVLDARKTEFKDITIRLLDQKTGHAGSGKNKILSNISEKRYGTTLDQFFLEYKKTNQMTIQIVELLQE